MVRIASVAAASWACLRAASRLGIAIEAMIKMIATTISNSIREKPLCSCIGTPSGVLCRGEDSSFLLRRTARTLARNFVPRPGLRGRNGISACLCNVPHRKTNLSLCRDAVLGGEVRVTGNIWKAWLVPGGLLLALSAALVNSSLLGRVAPSLAFYYFAVFAAGLLLSWRFNSSRVLFSLLVLLLAHRAVEFFSLGQTHAGPGRTALILAALLVPLNYIGLAFMRERGLTVSGVAPHFG